VPIGPKPVGTTERIDRSIDGTFEPVTRSKTMGTIKIDSNDLEIAVNEKIALELEVMALRAEVEAQRAKIPAIKNRGESAPRVTCSSVARGLIWEGYTNAEVWAVIKPMFNLSDDKKHYPAWYRSEQKKLIKDKMAAQA
jgi:hypothetical protein